MELLFIIIGILGFLIVKNSKAHDAAWEIRRLLMTTKYPFNIELQSDYDKKRSNYYYNTPISKRPKKYYSEKEKMMFDKDVPFHIKEKYLQDEVQEYMHNVGFAYAPGCMLGYMYKYFPEFGESQFRTRKEYISKTMGMSDHVFKNNEYDSGAEERWERELSWLRDYQQSGKAKEQWEILRKDLHSIERYPDKITF